MPIVNRVADLARRDHRLAARSACPSGTALRRSAYRRRPSPRSSRRFGCDEVVPGIGRTGVVGVIQRPQGQGPTR